MHAVGGLTKLTYLNLYSSNVTDAGLFELRDLPALTELYLNECHNVTDAGLRGLRGFTALTELQLGSPNITDVGIQELTTLTSLTDLWFFTCSTTKAGRDALKATIPGLTIHGY
jgi:Leucine-rich repeat (LRR) protein